MPNQSFPIVQIDLEDLKSDYVSKVNLAIAARDAYAATPSQTTKQDLCDLLGVLKQDLLDQITAVDEARGLLGCGQ